MTVICIQILRFDINLTHIDTFLKENNESDSRQIDRFRVQRNRVQNLKFKRQFISDRTDRCQIQIETVNSFKSVSTFE